MGLRDLLGKVADIAGTAAGATAKHLVDETNEIREYVEFYKNESDEELRRILDRTSDNNKKLAILKILNER